MLKTLNEHDQYTERSKDLMDEEMAEMRRDLESLRPLHCDKVTPKVIVSAPVTMRTSQAEMHTASNDPQTHLL